MFQIDAVTAVTLVTSVALLVWLILRLMLRPIEQRLDRWELPLSKVKGEDDLKNIINIEINKHERGCHKRDAEAAKEKQEA